MDSQNSNQSSIELDQRYRSLFKDNLEMKAACYASAGAYELASKTVLDVINQTQGKCPLHYWYLLFDILEITGQQGRHEKTSEVFSKLFSLSAPQYRGYEKISSSFSGRNSLIMEGWIGQLRSEKELDFLESSIHSKQAKLDISKCDFGKEPEECTRACQIIHRILQNLREHEIPTLLLGADSALQNLQNVFKLPYPPQDETTMKHWWYALLELYQWQNNEAAFEEQALNFAEKFGLSPPSFMAPTEFTPEHAQKPSEDSEFGIVPESEIVSFNSLKKQMQTRRPPWKVDCRMVKRWTVEAAIEAREFLMRQARDKLTLVEPNHVLIGVAKTVKMIEVLNIESRRR